MGDQGPTFAPCMSPLAHLQCQTWHSGSIVTPSPSLPPLGPLHSLNVTHFDYMYPTLTTCKRHRNLKCMLAPNDAFRPIQGVRGPTRGVNVYLGTLLRRGP